MTRVRVRYGKQFFTGVYFFGRATSCSPLLTGTPLPCSAGPFRQTRGSVSLESICNLQLVEKDVVSFPIEIGSFWRSSITSLLTRVKNIRISPLKPRPRSGGDNKPLIVSLCRLCVLLPVLLQAFHRAEPKVLVFERDPSGDVQCAREAALEDFWSNGCCKGRKFA